MNLSEKQIEQLKDFFEKADKKRLMYAPDEDKAYYLHGFMSGMREYLEELEVDIPGITGLWWYENLGEPRRSMSIKELSERYSKESWLVHVLSGYESAKTTVQEILNLK